MWNAPGDTNAEAEREREIMVCMIIFFTAEGNQLSGWIWWESHWLHNLRKGWVLTWYVIIDIMVTLSIQVSSCCWRYESMIDGWFWLNVTWWLYISLVASQAMHCLKQSTQNYFGNRQLSLIIRIILAKWWDCKTCLWGFYNTEKFMLTQCLYPRCPEATTRSSSRLLLTPNYTVTLMQRTTIIVTKICQAPTLVSTKS